MSANDTSRWARHVVGLARRHGEIPSYGSPAWHALPGGDERKIAALVIAAECWRLDGEPERIADRYLTFAAVVRAEVEAGEAASWAQVAQHVRRYADRPTEAEMNRRRALQPRPNDYPGRAGGAIGVDFETGKWIPAEAVA